MREIPQNYLIAGTGRIDLRKDIEEEIRKNKKLANKIKEIRFREVGFAMKQKSSINQNLKLKKIEYQASNGKEIFLQIVNKQNILFGLLRLRLEKLKKEPAMIRELHVYGPTLKLGEKSKENLLGQHKGLGKQLMLEAEKLARKDKRKSIRVISGVGVREYYKSLGYVLDENGIYMKKGIVTPI
jgi:elongator complex protein 3